MRNALVLTTSCLAICLAPFDSIAGQVSQPTAGDDLFIEGKVPKITIEIAPEGMEVLRQYSQVWGQPRPERTDVQATIREDRTTFTNVAIHLKGSFTFQPIDSKPSLTLNFEKFAPGQRFHGLSKVHLNNSVQDSSYLCEALAREVFESAGVPSPRAGHALVKLNGRDLGLFVLLEGANKQFVKRCFSSSEGNLYDGGSGGDITKALKADSGNEPENRTDLTNLVKAAREPDPVKRLAKLDQVLDVDRFLSFVATEIFLVHWDGYAMGPNNYRVFHDVSRDKMVFIPHGLDQLFGVSSSLALTITPHFNGLVAQALTTSSEGRRKYLERIGTLATNQFRVETLQGRVDRLASQLRRALAHDPQMVSSFDQAVSNLKARIAVRVQNVAKELEHPNGPLQFKQDQFVSLSGWRFKTGITQPAVGRRALEETRDVLQVLGRGTGSTGSWRTLVLLDEGHYEFTGKARAEGLGENPKKGLGVLLRVSGERTPRSISATNDWTILSYEFDVRGIADTELVCEFRGPQGSGSFDPESLRLFRRGPALKPRTTGAN